MKYLGIDFGTKKIGLAISDSKGKVVLPLTTIPNNKNVFNYIKHLIQERQIDIIVVGLPQDVNNNFTLVTRQAQNFAKKLKKILSMPVITYNEKYTSFEAEEKLKDLGIPFKRGKKYIDQLAAVEILKDYLNNNINNF